jgi:hypothetical protein
MTTSMPATPQDWHARHHPPEVSFADCWRCWRQRSICRTKRRYATWERADEIVKEICLREDFARPIQRYRCRWCLGWHLTSHPDKNGLKRHEKMRRKELARRAKVNT